MIFCLYYTTGCTVFHTAPSSRLYGQFMRASTQCVSKNTLLLTNEADVHMAEFLCKLPCLIILYTDPLYDMTRVHGKSRYDVLCKLPSVFITVCLLQMQCFVKCLMMIMFVCTCVASVHGDLNVFSVITSAMR